MTSSTIHELRAVTAEAMERVGSVTTNVTNYNELQEALRGSVNIPHNLARLLALHTLKEDKTFAGVHYLGKYKGWHLAHELMFNNDSPVLTSHSWRQPFKHLRDHGVLTLGIGVDEPNAGQLDRYQVTLRNRQAVLHPYDHSVESIAARPAESEPQGMYKMGDDMQTFLGVTLRTGQAILDLTE